jgi:hypothetical protein
VGETVNRPNHNRQSLHRGHRGHSRHIRERLRALHHVLRSLTAMSGIHDG